MDELLIKTNERIVGDGRPARCRWVRLLLAHGAKPGIERRAEMDTERMIRELESVEEKHKNDAVYTGQLNIAEMAHDVRKRLEELKPYEDTGLTPEQIAELKERNTAKEPEEIQDAFGDTRLICPNCRNSVINYFNRGRPPRFCMICGQRLKWRD